MVLVLFSPLLLSALATLVAIALVPWLRAHGH